MIGIVVASDLEAAPFLASFRWQCIAEKPFKLYKGAIGSAEIPAFFIISGIGKVAAAVAAHELIRNFDVTRIFNPGVCGALRDSKEFEIGAVFRISSAIEGDRSNGPFKVYPERCEASPFEALPCARLVTCDQPIFEMQRKRAMALLGDLIDMEGAAVARVANLYKLPCVLIKGITDGAAEGGRESLQLNIDAVSRKLADLFLNLSL